MQTVEMGCVMSASMFIAIVSVYMGIDRTNVCTPIVAKRMQCNDFLNCGYEAAQAFTSPYGEDDLNLAHRGCKR